jgi:hypothetical protein
MDDDLGLKDGQQPAEVRASQIDPPEARRSEVGGGLVDVDADDGLHPRPDGQPPGDLRPERARHPGDQDAHRGHSPG